MTDLFKDHGRPVDKTNIKSKPTTVTKHFLSHTVMQLIPPVDTHL